MTKGISLHIGVNSLNKNIYTTEGLLAAPENDARAMASIAFLEGYSAWYLLLTEDATKENLITTVNNISKQMNKGDIFFLSYSGHGSQLDGARISDEEDGKDEAWCLYNGFILDNELSELWKMFKEGVRIVVVTSCCHSRTSIRQWPQFQADKPLFSTGSSRQGQAQAQSDIVFKYITSPDIKAGIIHLSACKDSQEAHDGDHFSRFTSVLLSRWNYGRFRGSYIDFITDMSRETGFIQEPALGTLGVVEDLFINSKPFKI